MLAVFGPGQGGVVLRVARFAYGDDHVPLHRGHGGACDQVMFEEVVRRFFQFFFGQRFLSLVRHEAPFHQMLGLFRVDELEGVDAVERRGVILGRRVVALQEARLAHGVGVAGEEGFEFFRIGLACFGIGLCCHDHVVEGVGVGRAEDRRIQHGEVLAAAVGQAEFDGQAACVACGVSHVRVAAGQ